MSAKRSPAAFTRSPCAGTFRFATRARAPAETFEETNMRASTICTGNPVCVPREMTARAAAEEMHKRQVGSLIIVDASDPGGAPLGIVTDRDLVTRVIAAGRDPRTTAVSEVMTYPLVTCR